MKDGCQQAEVGQGGPVPGTGLVVLVGQTAHRPGHRDRRQRHRRARSNEHGSIGVIKNIRNGQADVRRHAPGYAQQFLPRFRIAVVEGCPWGPGVRCIGEDFNAVAELRRTGGRDLPLHEQLGADDAGRGVANENRVKCGLGRLAAYNQGRWNIVQIGIARATIGLGCSIGVDQIDIPTRSVLNLVGHLPSPALVVIAVGMVDLIIASVSGKIFLPSAHAVYAGHCERIEKRAQMIPVAAHRFFHPHALVSQMRCSVGREPVPHRKTAPEVGCKLRPIPLDRATAAFADLGIAYHVGPGKGWNLLGIGGIAAACGPADILHKGARVLVGHAAVEIARPAI